MFRGRIGLVFGVILLFTAACDDRDGQVIDYSQLDRGRDTSSDASGSDTTQQDVSTPDLSEEGLTIFDLQDASRTGYVGEDTNVTVTGIVTAIDTQGEPAEDKAGSFWILRLPFTEIRSPAAAGPSRCPPSYP